MTSSVSTPARAGQAVEVSLDAILLWSAVIPLLMIQHWRAAAVPGFLLVLSILVPGLRHKRATWLVAFAVWLPLLIVGWDRFEDHVYAIAYWILAVGIALGTTTVRRNLHDSARFLVAAVFGVAVLWKATSASYLRGDVFATVLTNDGRFDLLSRWIGGLDQPTIDANRAAFRSLKDVGAELAPIPLEMTDRFWLFVVALTIWTLVIETAIVIAFAVSDRHWLARIRHPALLAFCLSTYSLVPVLGFSQLFALLGIVVARERRWQLGYVAVALLSFIALL